MACWCWDYRFIDSLTRLGITHKPTNTKLRVQSGNSKTAFGLVGVPVCILDEPGAFDQTAGELTYAALRTAQGKPGSPLKLIIIGTLAPHGVPGNWWYELVQRGTSGSVYVQSVQGRPDRWDSWREIMRANPLASVDADTLATLREERAEAKSDSRLKAQFLSYRLNSSTRDESEMLLTVDDFKLAMARPVGLPAGRPIVGVDLGAGRAWSAAVAVWESGRVDALACAPGIPDLAAQERRDRVGSGTYRRLYERGILTVAEGLRVQPPSQLWEAIQACWGVPVRVIADRFRLGDLQDAVQGACPVEGRVTRWSEAAADIRALRRFTKDGPFSIVDLARLLLAESLAVSRITSDDQGSVRLTKSKNNTARDDVSAALLLAAGAFERANSAPVRKLSYASV